MHISYKSFMLIKWDTLERILFIKTNKQICKINNKQTVLWAVELKKLSFCPSFPCLLHVLLDAAAVPSPQPLIFTKLQEYTVLRPPICP